MAKLVRMQFLNLFLEEICTSNKYMCLLAHIPPFKKSDSIFIECFWWTSHKAFHMFYLIQFSNCLCRTLIVIILV